MADIEIFDEEAKLIIRAREIEAAEKKILESVVQKMIVTGSSEFNYGPQKYILHKSGELHNPGFQIETENLDGSSRHRNAWMALSGDQDSQISCVIRQVARLMANAEIGLSS